MRNIAHGRAAKRNWRALDRIASATLPGEAWRWLELGSSLTRALEAALHTPILVAVARQGRGLAFDDERRLLPGPRAAHIREIALLSNETPVVAARTVVPHASRRLLAHVRRLDTRPLAELLFADGPPRCLVREIALLRPGMSAFALLARTSVKASPACWARRSLFEIAGERLLVTEIFLPGMFGTA